MFVEELRRFLSDALVQRFDQPEIGEFGDPIDLDHEHVGQLLRLVLHDRTIVEAGEGRVDRHELDIGMVLLEGRLDLGHELLADLGALPLAPTHFLLLGGGGERKAERRREPSLRQASAKRIGGGGSLASP